MKAFVTLALVAIMALSTIAIGAEGDDKPRKRPDEKKARDGKGDRNPFAGLDLTDEQKEKIDAIRKEFGPKFKAAQEAKDREAFGKLRKEMMEAVGEILTDAQKEKLKKQREAGDKKRPDKKRPEKKPADN